MPRYRVERWYTTPGGEYVWFAYNDHEEAGDDAVDFPTWREAYDYAYGRTRMCRCGLGSLYDCENTSWGCAGREASGGGARPRRRRR